MADSTNVTAAKPYLGGGAFVAPLGTALPAGLYENLDPAFEDLGFISDDGMDQDRDTDSTDVQAWGGQTVLNSLTKDDHTFKATFLEGNVNVLKEFFGDGAVSQDATTKVITVSPTAAKTPGRRILVFDILLSETKRRRIIIPNAQASDWGTITYKDSDAVSYKLTYTAYADSNGKPWTTYDGPVTAVSGS